MATDPATRLTEATRVHFVGIGGAGMAALATLLLRMGKQVSGSDLAPGPATRHLREIGARVYEAHAADNVDGAEYVVRSSAVSPENSEVVEAERRGLPSVKLAEAVGQLMQGRRGVGIAGTHGKTTTTALTAWLLDRGGLDPLALIGADALNFGGSAVLGEGPMVVEADEYDRRFLHLSPEVAVVTSVEPDHLDYFRDLAEIRDVFQAFTDKLPRSGRLIVCADDPGALALTSEADRETYGFGAGADWRLADYAPLPGVGSRFTVHALGRAWTVESTLIGEHNARNAVAALAVADYFGVGLRAALAGLATFRGTRRRFETKGRPREAWVVDDYAHHPTAVEATLRAARGVLPAGGSLWAVFQPHTTNRTAALFHAFAQSFGAADHALLLPIYKPSGREVHARPVTSEELVEAIKATGHPDARFLAGFDEATSLLANAVRPGDLVLTMGAGDVTLLANHLVQALEGDG